MKQNCSELRGGFYLYPSKEIFWAYWARYIYVNRYLDPPKPTYEELLSKGGVHSEKTALYPPI